METSSLHISMVLLELQHEADVFSGVESSRTGVGGPHEMRACHVNDKRTKILRKSISVSVLGRERLKPNYSSVPHAARFVPVDCYFKLGAPHQVVSFLFPFNSSCSSRRASAMQGVKWLRSAALGGSPGKGGDAWVTL